MWMEVLQRLALGSSTSTNRKFSFPLRTAQSRFLEYVQRSTSPTVSLFLDAH